MTRNFYTQQLGILKNSKNFVKNTQAQHLDEVSWEQNTVLSLHTNFKSTSNPNCLGDVRSLPRRRQRLWRTSCWWEVLRSWEGETRLHFEQIIILIIIAMQKLNLFGSRVYPYTSSQNGRLVATPMWLEGLLGDTDSLRLIKRYFAWFVVTLKSVQRQHKYEHILKIAQIHTIFFCKQTIEVQNICFPILGLCL